MTDLAQDDLAEQVSRARAAGHRLDWLERMRASAPGAERSRSDVPAPGGSHRAAEALAGDLSANLTGRPNGALPRTGLPQIGAYPFRSKHEVWAYNVRKLYQEAVSRQWSSATDIPWHTLVPLPDDVEAAECQLATFFTEVEFVAADAAARFVATISPDYHEVRQFLTTQMIDESRHLEVFRKRALANGGGLMRRTDSVSGVIGGTTDEARDFTEMSSRLHVVGEGAVLTLFRTGELMAYNEAEKAMYRRAAQDEARHVAFGILHLKYIAHASPERREEIHTYLDEVEARHATGAGGENPAGRKQLTSEALAVLLGGGKNKIDEGQKLLLAIRQRQASEYLQRLKSAGFDERVRQGRVNPALFAGAKAT